MKLWKSLCVSVLTGSVAAQTPENFNVTASTALQAVVQPSNITVTPSLLVSQKESLNTPWIYLPSGASSDELYLLIMIDSALPLLQWMQPNLVVGFGNNLSFDAVTQGASAAVGAPYVYPQPPVGQLHEYVFLLYQQPSNWAFPTNYSTFNPPATLEARAFFEIGDFQRSSGLDNPIAASYMRVLNSTAEASSSLISVTQTALTLSTSAMLGPTSTMATTETGSSMSATTSAPSATATATVNTAASLVQPICGMIGGLLGSFVLAL